MTDWRRILRYAPVDGAGLEHLHVYGRPDTIRARGTLIGETGGKRFGLLYEITLDPDWTFRSVLFQRTDGVMKVISSDGKGNWVDMFDEPLPQLAGCIDIDIAGTPFTNTLPIRRHTHWVTGQPERFDMAWVPLDTLEPVRDGQIYTPLGEGRWRYQAADGSFEAGITVDEDGFVLDYAGSFRRAE
jgi:hypothetical protein